MLLKRMIPGRSCANMSGRSKLSANCPINIFEKNAIFKKKASKLIWTAQKNIPIRNDVVAEFLPLGKCCWSPSAPERNCYAFYLLNLVKTSSKNQYPHIYSYRSTAVCNCDQSFCKGFSAVIVCGSEISWRSPSLILRQSRTWVIRVFERQSSVPEWSLCGTSWWP